MGGFRAIFLIKNEGIQKKRTIKLSNKNLYNSRSQSSFRNQCRLNLNKKELSFSFGNVLLNELKGRLLIENSSTGTVPMPAGISFLMVGG